MTTLAQLHDCHSCNDERSIVQKKKSRLCEENHLSLPALYCLCSCLPKMMRGGLLHKHVNMFGIDTKRSV